MKFKNNSFTRLRILLIISFGILLNSCDTNSAKEYHKYYVSLNGSDTNNGSLENPFRTIKKGASLLNAGDTLVVKPGDYGFEFAIKIDKNGTAEKPIVVMAEKQGSVYLKGLRKEGEVNGTGKDGAEGCGFLIANVSYVVIDGFHLSNYVVGIDVGIWDSKTLNIVNIPNKSHHVTIKNCIFDNNGEDGIQTFRVDSVLISNCTFSSDFIMETNDGNTYPNAIQDYGCNFYSSTASVVENCYFYGAHNQALSFKEGDKDCIARRNVFEGALYTAIYLGQNRLEDETDKNKNPSCQDLIAEYNIVRGTKGYRVKSPIRADNVVNAVIRNNYFEGFDETHKTSGINIFDEAKGTIQIYNNIVAFSVDKKSSAGVEPAEKLSRETRLNIHNNTFYNLAKDIWGQLDANDVFEKNISYKCAYYLKNDKKNFHGNPKFNDGEPKQLPVSTAPVKPDFASYYKKLTDQFRLSENSPAKGFGAFPE